ncbi:TenA family protein [Sciscionella marina]|uniref:TenA family protein n=1 Tax=Sciscionella marina TaxID=508770 RepID=UPI0003807C57|nr:TenA family protein [Sciscionella marina]
MTEAPLSARLRAENSGTWQAALGMRFVEEVSADTIPDAVFARYLVFEREFVDTAARLCGAAVREAPNARALSGHSTALHNLVTEQYDYFSKALADIGGAPEVSAAAQEQAGGLTEVVLDIADTYGYPGIVTGMYTAESLYGQWCATAARTPSQRGPIADWVALHTREPFLTQVRFLAAEIDALEVLPETERELLGVFGHTLEAEIAFHEAAYQ